MAGFQPPAVQIGAKDLVKLMTTFSPAISVCIRGRHAVGKSEITYQAASQMRDDFYKDPENAKQYDWTYEQGLPVIERRLSQLTEGDLTGMPNLDSARKSTEFKPCDWLMDACDRPVVLFLDERNRALEGVKQAVFQLMDSKAFYGNKLHPGTRVVVAENIGEFYQVQACDPAETSRPAIVELCPSVEEWLEYAGPRCHEATVAFIRANREYLEFNPNAATGGPGKEKNQPQKVYEPNKKYPDRRAWFKLDKELNRENLFDQPTSGLFYLMAASMVGQEAAVAFKEFVVNMDRSISLEDLLTDWAKAHRRMVGNGKSGDVSASKYLELSKKLEAFFKSGQVLTDAQAKNVGEFMRSAPAEARMVTWAALQNSVKNLFRVHKHVEDLMLRTATGEDTSVTTPAPPAAGVSVPAPPKQRGAVPGKR